MHTLNTRDMLLVRANMTAATEDKLPEAEVIAQISYVLQSLPHSSVDVKACDSTFTFAAMDTTSNALSITLMLLGDHPDVQQRLRDEILSTFDDEEHFDYDKLVSLPYLDAVCRETLRL